MKVRNLFVFPIHSMVRALALGGLILAVPLPAAAQHADGTGELSTAPLTLKSEIAPPVNCALDSGDIVAWDVSNGATTADHSTLIADLQAAGFVVRTVNVATDGIPPCIVKLVITTQAFNSCLTSLYPPARVNLVKNEVESGLGLFLLNEWGFFCGHGTAPIANALGTTWAGNVGASQTFFANTHYDPSNPSTLFSGVFSWRQFAGSDYSTSDGVVVTTSAGRPAMIAKRVERGCVVIAGDSNWIADNWIGFNDNRTLASNALKYLNECLVLEVKIDVKPGSFPNSINVDSKGVVPVAILTTSVADGDSVDFDAWDVDPATVTFGPNGAGIVHATGHAEDVDGDGDIDMVLHFKTDQTGIACGETEATLEGRSFGGQAIEGTDSIRTLVCR